MIKRKRRGLMMAPGKGGISGKWTGRTSCRRRKGGGTGKMMRGRRRRNSWSLEDSMMKKPKLCGNRLGRMGPWRARKTTRRAWHRRRRLDGRE